MPLNFKEGFMEKEILVSVVVLTYNAAKTVTETLDSIAGQTYPNIEIVIADDASKDNTIEVVKKWCSEKGKDLSGFVVSQMPQNSGVPANLNAGIRKANGKYIKIIAADDILLENCISTNVSVCEKNDYKNLVTWFKKFIDTPEGRTYEYVEPDLEFFASSAQKQYEKLLEANIVYGCTFFAQKKFLQEMGLYNEKYRLIEDYPMWIKMTKNGKRINYHNEITVLYRSGEPSLSNFVGRQIVNARYVTYYDAFVRKEILPALLKKGRIRWALGHIKTLIFHWLVVVLGNDRQKKAAKLLERIYNKRILSSLKHEKK